MNLVKHSYSISCDQVKSSQEFSLSINSDHDNNHEAV